jgi:hypothetical protein
VRAQTSMREAIPIYSCATPNWAIDVDATVPAETKMPLKATRMVEATWEWGAMRWSVYLEWQNYKDEYIGVNLLTIA